MWQYDATSSGGSKNFEKGGGGAEDNLSAPSSFTANAHNEIYAFYTEEAAFWKKIWANGGTAPHRPLLNPPLATRERFSSTVYEQSMLWPNEACIQPISIGLGQARS